MLVHRLRRWPNIKASLVKRVVFAGNEVQLQMNDNQNGKLIVQTQESKTES